MRIDVGSSAQDEFEVLALQADKCFAVESFGVRVVIESNRDDVLAKARNVVQKALVGQFGIIENENTLSAHRFGIVLDDDGMYHLFENGKRTCFSEREFVLFKYFDSTLRITVAERAVDRVFVHAGVVGWEGGAILFPARSFQGKSRMVAAMIALGAEYYSDEYAVLDEQGLVHPFPREITLRGIEHEYVDTEVSPASLGARIGIRPIPVSGVFLTKYEPDALWRPEELSLGIGVMEVLMHTIPFRANTVFSLKVLNNAFARAIIARSSRAEAALTARQILAYLNEKLNLSGI